MEQRSSERRYAPPEARLSEPRAEAFTWGRTVWLVWSLSWRSALLNLPVSVTSSALQGVFAEAPLAQGLVLLTQIALAWLIQLAVARRVFGMTFRTFGVRLSPAEQGPSWSQALAIWWCYTWRTAAVTLVPFACLVGVLAFVPLGLLVGPFLFVPLAVWLSLLAFRSALVKEYRGFALEIVGP